LDGDGDGTQGPDFVQTGLLGLPGVTVTPVVLSLAEGGSSAGVTIVLKAQPTDDVVITPISDGFVTANGVTLTFTSVNWNVPQVLQVSAVDDAYYEGTHNGTLTFSAASSDVRYQGIVIPSVSATITDNDTPPMVQAVQVNDGSVQRSNVKS